MNIGQRLRELRESKGLSQGHIQERTGLLRCYISRVECGHTIPTIETVEKWAKALDLELYQLFYFGESEPQEPETAKFDRPGIEQQRLLKVFDKLGKSDRALLLAMARTLSNHRAH
ncbi:MAG: helix-turn-helix transcriptional regulator [Planctomycetota bacterium]